MKPMRVLLASLALGLAACAGSAPSTPAAKANPPNVLDAYVARPDPSFAWKVEKTFSGQGYRGVVIDLTSQTWTPKVGMDRNVWKHWLTVTIPDTVTSDKALLFIGGGSNGRAAPAGPSPQWAQMAVDTSSIVAELGQVPNQPLDFGDGVKRTEDDIIAFLQARYDPKGDPEALVRLPMVKSGAAAMTAVQQFMATADGGGRKIDGFVVSGGSKRGWTSWLVGLTDPRVIGMIPIVINVLDVDATTKHHWMAMGYFSPALGDYVNHKLIPFEIGRGMVPINAVEDPLNYRGRPRMKIPKYIINAVGDEYFPPDNTKFSYHLLPAPKSLRMLPNSKHSTAGTDIGESMTAWYDAIIRKRPVPSYSWTMRADGEMVVQPGALKPSQVLLWQGANPKARDFRVDTLGAKAFTSSPLQPQADGSYVVPAPKPATGFTAWFVELTYPSGTKYPFKFTTEVQVTPDVLPYRWEDARPITAPEAK